MSHVSRRALAFGLLAAAALPALPAQAAEMRVNRNVAYGTDRRQRVDVYLPAARTRPVPFVAFLHGGGWRNGDKALPSVWTEKAAHWTARGIGFVSINTRLLPEVDPLEQAADLAAAVAMLQRRGRDLGLDSDRMALMGHSAGAHLALLIASAPDIPAAAGARPWRGTISLDTAMIDVEAAMSGRPPRLYRQAFGDDPAFWRAASPWAQLDRRPAPMLLVCASGRRTSCSEAQGFAAAIGALGGRAEVLPLDKSHGEINSDLGLPGDYTDTVDAFLTSIGIG